MNIPNIALVGNAPRDKHDILNAMLAEDDLTGLCSITLYGADGQPEMEALKDAVEDWRTGEIQGIVCLPMQTSLRKAMNHAGINTDNILLINATGNLLFSTTNNSKSAEETTGLLNSDTIVNRAEMLARNLRRDFRIENPRIAITSLNQHIDTDEESVEMKVIVPAITETVNKGIQTFGPYTVENLFPANSPSCAAESYDCIMTMYDGQCSNQSECLSDKPYVCIASGAEIPITQSEPAGILNAIYAVIDIMRNRLEYDVPFANPLEKLYHERKEGSDKTRFTVKKKGFNPAEHRRENITYVTKKKDDKDTTDNKENTDNTQDN